MSGKKLSRSGERGSALKPPVHDFSDNFNTIPYLPVKFALAGAPGTQETGASFHEVTPSGTKAETSASLRPGLVPGGFEADKSSARDAECAASAVSNWLTTCLSSPACRWRLSAEPCRSVAVSAACRMTSCHCSM